MRDKDCSTVYRARKAASDGSAPRIGLLDSSQQNCRPEESNNLEASGGQEIDDLLNGVVGAVVGGFEFAGWLVSGIWAVREAAVGQRSAEAVVGEEDE